MPRVPIIWEYVANQIFDISSLSLVDRANLSAHLYSLLCGIEDQEEILRERGYSPERIAIAMQTKPNAVVEIAGLRFTRPVEKFKYEHMDMVLSYLKQFDLGNLPFPGSVSEQPAQIMEIFSLIKNIQAETQTKLIKQEENKNVRHNQNKSGTGRQRRK